MKNAIIFVAIFAFTSLAQAQAVVPVELQTTADNIEAGWAVVRGLVIGFVSFWIALAFVKKLSGKI